MNLDQQRRVAHIVLSEFEKISNIKEKIQKVYSEHKGDERYLNVNMKRRNTECLHYTDDKGESVNKTLNGAGFWYLSLHESLLRNLFSQGNISDDELRQRVLSQLDVQNISLWQYLPLDDLYIQTKYTYRGHRYPDYIIYVTGFLSPENIVKTEESYEEKVKSFNGDIVAAFPYKFYNVISDLRVL